MFPELTCLLALSSPPPPKQREKFETLSTQLVILQKFYRLVTPQITVNYMNDVWLFFTASEGLSEIAENFPTVKKLVNEKFFSEQTFRLPEADFFQLSPFR